MNHGSCLLAGFLACAGMAVASNDTNVFSFEHLVAREPFAQFKAWFDEATNHEKVTTEGFKLAYQLFTDAQYFFKVNRANTMSLATATVDGFPSARMVVLKE